jgi:hypothetical protein
MTTEHAAEAFESRLTDGTDRFISHMIEHAFTIGRRTSRDFLRHFPPSAIMDALRDSPSLRADILESSTGVRRKVALKKSAISSGEDLQIALDEGEAAHDEVVRLFRPDDRVRYLPRGKLWGFLIEGEFWKANKTDKGSYERAQAHIAFLLDRALRDGVLNHKDIVEGISVAKICQLMPRQELETAMNSALGLGRKGQPFSDRDLYDNLTSATLVNYVPLTHIWDEVVHPCAVEHSLTDALSSANRDPKAVLPAVVEEAAKPVTANTNDQPAQAPAQPRVVVSKPSTASTNGAPSTTVKRPQGVATATPVAMAVSKPSAPVKVVTAAEATPEEDEAFDVHFDNLTASKG